MPVPGTAQGINGEIPKEGLTGQKVPSGTFPEVPQQSAKPKVPGQAFVKSLLFPGWGELYAGAGKRARTFIIAEGLLWASFSLFEIYGGWKRSDMEDFAIARASVSGAGKKKTYYTDISNYNDIYEHNEEMRRFRRYDDVYPVTAENYWSWSSEADRERFDRLRLSSAQAKRNATLLIGAVITNHVLSAIDAIYVVRRQNREMTTRLDVLPVLSDSGDYRLNLRLSAHW